MSGPAGPAYVVAGLAVRTNRAAAELVTEGFCDGAVEIRFGAPTESEGGVPEGWHLLPDGRVPAAWLSGDGRRAVVSYVDDADVARQIRRVVPFASALQGLVVLHAAAFVWRDVAVAIVGPSGSGKSTWAEALARRGYRVLTDDLLPCREHARRVVVPVVERAGAPPGRLHLAALLFLEREPTFTHPTFSPVSRSASLGNLLRHGFGEHRVPSAWEAQFRVYAQVAEDVPAVHLAVPDARDRLDDAVDLVLEKILPAFATKEEKPGTAEEGLPCD